MKSRVALLLALGALTLPALALSQTTFSAPNEPGATAPAPEAASGPPAAPAFENVAFRSRRDKPKPRRSFFGVARVSRAVALRTRPRGPVASTVGAVTEFGSPQILSVAARRGRWLGVVSTAMPNNQLAWVRRDDPGLRAARVGYSLHADLSQHQVELRKDGRVLRRLSVAIGRAGSSTPTGRFAVTDKLRGTSFGPYYGCCILALSAHQPNLPAGWTGGNRIAIHGTNSPGTVGMAASAGCLRAHDADLEVLMRRVPLGTPVVIHA